MQDNEGNRYSLRADNYSDRLSFDEDDSLIIHNALLKGGTLKFSISEVKNNITEYKFNIEDANWYENAYKQLEE